VQKEERAMDWPGSMNLSYSDIQARRVLLKAAGHAVARLFSGFLRSKKGQQKIADLDIVVVRKAIEPKIALDRSKLRVSNPMGQ
jgi:hypothetical protein